MHQFKRMYLHPGERGPPTNYLLQAAVRASSTNQERETTAMTIFHSWTMAPTLIASTPQAAKGPAIIWITDHG
jgi:hypothetical protein